MLKKITVISLLLVGMVACDPTPSCTLNVNAPNAYYVVSIDNGQGGNITLRRLSNSARQVTVGYNCGSVIRIDQA